MVLLIQVDQPISYYEGLIDGLGGDEHEGEFDGDVHVECGEEVGK